MTFLSYLLLLQYHQKSQTRSGPFWERGYESKKNGKFCVLKPGSKAVTSSVKTSINVNEWLTF